MGTPLAPLILSPVHSAGLVAIFPLRKAAWSLGTQLQAHSLGNVGTKAAGLTGEKPGLGRSPSWVWWFPAGQGCLRSGP